VQFTVYTTRDGLPSDQITAVQAGKSGRIWVGTLCGLACFTDGRIGRIHTAGSNEVRSVHEDSQGTLWFGVRDARLHRLDQDKDQPIAALTIADQSGPGWATGMCDGPNGDLWIGTTGAGLHLFNKGEAVKTYTLTDGLQDRSVFSLEIDRQQRLWIGEGEGVDLLRKSGIKAVPGENPQTVPIEEIIVGLAKIFLDTIQKIYPLVVVDLGIVRRSLPEFAPAFKIGLANHKFSPH